MASDRVQRRKVLLVPVQGRGHHLTKGRFLVDLGGISRLEVMNPNREEKPRNGKSHGFSISSSWDIGPRTPMWDQLWARILGDVLSPTNLRPTDEEECRSPDIYEGTFPLGWSKPPFGDLYHARFCQVRQLRPCQRQLPAVNLLVMLPNQWGPA